MLSAMPVVDLVGAPPVTLVGGGLGAIARRTDCCDDCSCGCGNCCPGCSGSFKLRAMPTSFPGFRALSEAGLSAYDLGALAAGVMPPDPVPGMPAPPDHPPLSTGQTVLAVGLAVGGLAALFAIGAYYNKWAYGDWTCMFKACTQTSTKRR
jgi:hypothetical protein